MLNSQEIFGDELAMFAKKELQKEVREEEESLFSVKDVDVAALHKKEGRRGGKVVRQQHPPPALLYY